MNQLMISIVLVSSDHPLSRSNNNILVPWVPFVPF